jgi:uncharacterized protein YjbJ (UPF0337 family)
MDDVRKNAMDEQIKGKVQKAKGAVKESVGNLTGNERQRAEGEADQVAGDLRDKAGKAVHGIADAGERLKDKIKGNG